MGRTKELKSAGKKDEDGIFRNYLYLYKGWIQHSKWNLLFVVFGLAGTLSATYMGMYIPKLAVSLVMEGVSVQKLITSLVLAGLFLLAAEQIGGHCEEMINNPCLKYRHVLEKKILQKMCSTTYANLEDPEYRKKIDHSKELYFHWNRDVKVCIYDSYEFLYMVIQILISSGVLIMLHPVVVAVMAAGIWSQYQVDKLSVTWNKKHRDFWQPLEMKIEYIADRVSDFSYAKDMRLYAADNWLMPKYRRLMRQRLGWNRKELRQKTQVGVAAKVVDGVRQAVVYSFLIRAVLLGQIGGDDFILYVSLSMSLNRAMANAANMMRRMKENVLSISDYRKMLAVPDSQTREEGNAPKLPEGRAPEITFSHVSFRYPCAEKETLRDIHFTIRSGEKIAVVGLNGAGKTTLIKLLCGMYEPSSGEIRMDGHPAVRWDLESWYCLFSVVFQDIEVLPATIAENVAACAPDELDRNRVRECLRQAGLWEMVDRLPKGMDTCLHKEMFRDGINLSGGESQKLLLARAIYREAPVLILDEPTSALDAIAENQLYLQYNELTKGRTSVFISHRLSSTRFCDRILMMEDGRIVEEGSHEELMEKQGAYYRLFQVQSHYYRNDRTEAFQSQMNPEWGVNSYVSK